MTYFEILEGIDRENYYFLLAGCAPCQPFSLINQNDNQKDKRKNLVLEFARLIEETKPDFLLMENVPGLKNGKGKEIFNEFESRVDNLGFFYDSKVLDAKNFEVPQKRKRLVFSASMHFPVKIPNQSENYKIITVRDAISKYIKIPLGKNIIPNHEVRSLSELNKERLRFIKKDGGSRKDLPEKLILKCHKDYNGHSDVYGRMKWDDLAPTLTCKCTSISNGRFGHPTQTRGISVREAAALQTFKDDYVFYGPITDTTRWVGNAVPVKFAENIGRIFLKNG